MSIKNENYLRARIMAGLLWKHLDAWYMYTEDYFDKTMLEKTRNSWIKAVDEFCDKYFPIEQRMDDGRPKGWTEVAALQFMAEIDCDQEFASMFLHGAWDDIKRSFPHFVSTIYKKIGAPTPVDPKRGIDAKAWAEDFAFRQSADGDTVEWFEAAIDAAIEYGRQDARRSSAEPSRMFVRLHVEDPSKHPLEQPMTPAKALEEYHDMDPEEASHRLWKHVKSGKVVKIVGIATSMIPISDMNAHNVYVRGKKLEYGNERPLSLECPVVKYTTVVAQTMISSPAGTEWFLYCENGEGDNRQIWARPIAEFLDGCFQTYDPVR